MQPYNAAHYTNQLRQLMPRGLAWKNPLGSVGDSLMKGEAEELARIDARAVYLCLYEFYAQSTRELLPEWEEEYGLPDPCTTLGATYEERIEDLLRKIRTIGGQSIAYLVGVAAAFGIAITITEFRPFRAGLSRAGERLNGRHWLHVFLVNGPAVKVYKFRSGISSAGDRLRHWRGNEVLECLINRLKPAHTYAMFGYEDAGSYIFDSNERGDIIVLDNPRSDNNSPAFDVDEDGNVTVMDAVETNAEDDYIRTAEDGNIVVRDELGNTYDQ